MIRTEIFVEPELEELVQPENAAEWRSVCEELGLETQLSLTRNDSSAGPPYLKVDPKTERIIMTLCPRKVKLSEYKESTIPTEVLKEAKRCKDNGWYDELYVAYDDRSPDPFLLGKIKHPQYDWLSTYHMIARWGDELLPWEQLEQKAVARMKDSYKKALERLRNECATRLQDVEGDLRLLLDNGDRSSFKLPKLDFDEPGRL